MSNEPKRYDLYAGLNVSAYTTATAVLKCEESETGMWIDYKDYEKLKKQLEWQPIETAPKCGMSVLGFFPNFSDDSIQMTYYSKGWKNGLKQVHPTHWMPLPEPPPQ